MLWWRRLRPCYQRQLEAAFTEHKRTADAADAVRSSHDRGFALLEVMYAVEWAGPGMDRYSFARIYRLWKQRAAAARANLADLDF